MTQVSDKAESEAKIKADQTKIETKLRNERTNLRRLFSIAANTFDEIHREIDKGKDIHIRYNKVGEKAERLFRVDEEIKNLICLTDEDYDAVESYRDRFTEIRVIYEKICNRPDENSSIISDKISHDNLKLPKLRLKEYDLMPRSWVAFWGQFCRIHEDENLREEDKFQYLLSSLKTKTKARDIAESYPPSKDNYLKVVEHLKSRFGRKDLLIEVYIRDLLTLVNSKSNIRLTDLYDKLGSYLRALESLGVTTSNYAAMLYPVVESCLPAEILKAWNRSRLNGEIKDEEDPVLTKERVLENLMSFLRHEVESEEHRILAENSFGGGTRRRDYIKSFQRDEPTASTLTANTSTRKICCVFCDRSHSSQDCRKLSTMTLDDRKSQVMKKGCCLVCLKPGHMAKRCHSNVKCLICERRHYALLCPDLRKGINSSTENKVTDEEQKSTEILLTNLPSEREIYLKTIAIRLQHGNKEVCVRALLDDGSHRSYIEKSLVTELNLTPSGREMLSQGLFGGGISPIAEHGRYTITVKSLDRKYSTVLSLLDQPKICSTLPRIRDGNLLAELASRGIRLTDVGRDTPPIRVLLGADVLGSLLTGRIEVLTSGVSAVETLLGWAILGLGKKRQVVNMVTLTLQNIEVPKLWDLEILGITDPVERKNKALLEEETLTHFKETLRVCEDKRYEVALPWLAGHPALYDKSDIAESRLHTVTKRLISENNFEAYDAVFLQWESEGIIETVPEEQISKPSHYLPHRPVIKLSNVTTKIRPVFDASFKRPGYASLNECLSVGPSLIHQIPPLLLRFRSGALGVIADIKQAFLQIRQRSEDRDVLRFLWWENAERTKLKIFRHCRVVFGITSSPFLLNATINYHLRLQRFQTDDLQNTICKLKEGFYVDNLITSVNDVEELDQLKTQAIQVMREGGFELRCWASNGSIESGNEQMVLGLKWNVAKDELSCKLPSTSDIFENDKPVTKRMLLSVINSIYDPIGFTSPALLLPKLLLQESWRKKIGWDEVLPPELEQKYRRWEKTTVLIPQCTIPRRVFPENYDEVTLHVFSDASSYAYAACAFLRCEYSNQVTVKLITAKARIAPLQNTTIPRLELLGAAVGARLAATLHPIQPSPVRTYYWTDSMIVLSWISKKEPWNTFVGNRVKEIRELTNIDDWRHVPGEINPADLATRPCDWLDLLESQWWKGPNWLYGNKESWPISEISIPEEAFLERRKTVLTNLVVENEERFGTRFLYFSSYTRILRMTAYVLRFCNNIKKNSHKLTKDLSYEEIERAETSLIKIIQSEWPLEKRQKYINTIQFYIDNGILRVQTKLILSQEPENFTRPIVLPDHPILERLILHTHKSLMHAGVLTTLTQLRERFWIPKGRRVVRAALRQCVQCKKLTSKNVNPDPAPLPPNRMGRVSAFQITGADLAGPLFLRGGSKAWIVLFTCAVYRAVHLELVSSLSTETFMQALRRFWARRGRCSTIYTDNGTNFRGAANALKSLDWSLIQTECALIKIKWLFSPPSAPWYGGFWERLIRSVKELLRKSLGRACVTYEEMLTLLSDCEATINGRPLTYLSDDPNELKPLTPAHFIQDLREQETIDLDLIESQHLLERVRYLHTLRQNLRKRFYKEYLGELVRNPRVASRRKMISPGDIVLIESTNPNRMNWPLAQVIELFPGKDNVERVAKLRVANGEIIRPVQRIYPLEFNSDNFCEMPKETKVIPELEYTDTDSSEKLKVTQCETKVIPELEYTDTDSSEKPKVTRCGRRVVPVKRMNL